MGCFKIGFLEKREGGGAREPSSPIDMPPQPANRSNALIFLGEDVEVVVIVVEVSSFFRELGGVVVCPLGMQLLLRW